MKKKTFVTIVTFGETRTHLPGCGLGDYLTLCGVDGDDPHWSVKQRTVPTPVGQKVNCPTCKAIWAVAMRFSRDDFED